MISVIIPTYNRTDMLREAVSSVLELLNLEDFLNLAPGLDEALGAPLPAAR